MGTLCALRHIGKDRFDLDSFAAFLPQPDTVEFAHDGITIDTPFLPLSHGFSRIRSPATAHVFFFWLIAAWVKSRAERPSVSVVNRQLHVQIGCKLGIRNRKDELEASKAKQITN